MTYNRTNWVDYPDLSTPINAARLNNMEAGIADAIQPGQGQIVDADVAPNAGIQYAKLLLALQILDGDISPAAAIAISKLAGYPGDVTKVLRGDGSWSAVAGQAGTELDYKAITADVTGIAVATEATAVAVITGNSVTYDGSRVLVRAWLPGYKNQVGTAYPHWTLFRDSTPLGQTYFPPAAVPAFGGSVVVELFDTPPAGAHVYSLRVFLDSTGTTLTVKAGAGGSGNQLPGFLRVTKA